MTGATGFVGAEALAQALAAGHHVTALTRRPQPATAGVEWVSGTLQDADALDKLVRGSDVVLHIAGTVNAPGRAGFEAGNVTGTANVIAAMHRTGVRRLVHVSSLAARQPALSDYCWSKFRAEENVCASGLDWTIVRPPAVYGPRDTEFFEVLRVARYGWLPVPSAGRASLIHVRDLARALLATCSTAGGAYDGQTWEVDDGAPNGLSHLELAAAMGRALHRKVRAIPLPQAILMRFASIDRLLRGRHAKLTPDRVRYMCYPDWVVDPARKPPPALWAPQIGIDGGLAEIALPFRAANRS
ncbi:MAG: NAD(P)H-binding protein [Sphingobium sp.]